MPHKRRELETGGGQRSSLKSSCTSHREGEAGIGIARRGLISGVSWLTHRSGRVPPS